MWTLNFLCSFVSVNTSGRRMNGLKLCGSFPQTLAKAWLCFQLKESLQSLLVDSLKLPGIKSQRFKLAPVLGFKKCQSK